MLHAIDVSLNMGLPYIYGLEMFHQFKANITTRISTPNRLAASGKGAQ